MPLYPSNSPEHPFRKAHRKKLDLNVHETWSVGAPKNRDFIAGHERLRIGSMSFSAAHHLTKKNMTYAPAEVAIEPRPWEPQTVLIVAIFGMVCLLHLMAFLYSLRFQHHGNNDPKAFAGSLSEPKENKDVAFLKF
ncbi:hypothetical protein XENTR_v10009816 [Xenopus tropicalis]|uniref:Uncharacterized protein LOC100492487 n=1 Tax=Xenopus tropicalis TaxID=8364 RepID=A0A8J0QJE3_XENTR|nr:uncharacterized protein LOC100492487 [Xenopus tropicalis]KAE8619502.1 hypothetical protein XENTR_v10009816 [Xenopus tropicalis]|eukprot:XP_002932771.1 PREDICTED: uncharacterized protein LOC100492487 [Xenopus tropicalis]